MDNKCDLTRTANEILKIDPVVDIFAIQEIGRFCVKDCYNRPLNYASSDQVKELQDLLPGYSIYFESKTNRFGGEYGTAIGYRSSLTVSRKECLRFKGWNTHHASNLVFGELEQVAVAIRVEHLWVISLHLGCDLYGSEQLEEVRELESWIEHDLLNNNSGLDRSIDVNGISVNNDINNKHQLYTTVGQEQVIVCGDFNSTNYYSAIKKMKQTWMNVYDCNKATSRYNTILPRVTFPSNFPVICLDYIFYRGKTIHCTYVEVIKSLVSDHLPLYACFELRNEEDENN